MNIKKIVITFFLLSFTVIAFGQYRFTIVENDQYKTYLDSLKRISYLQDVFLSQTVNNEAKLVADEVYIERLSKISSHIPLTFNAKVRAYIELLVSSRRAESQIMLGLSANYFPMFEKTLKKYQLPLEFKYLPMAQSGYFMRAFSNYGSSGFWQLSFATGKRYNLLISSYTDERRNIQKSTEVAAQYLRELWDIYKDWTLVLASYSCGPTNVNKAIARANGERDFWKIYEHLPIESREIVASFIACIYISNYANEHNLQQANISLPTFLEQISVEKKLHFGQISNVLHVPIMQLRDMNPEYKKDIVNPLESRNTLLVSSETKKMFMVYKDSVYSYNIDNYFQADKGITINQINKTKVNNSNQNNNDSQSSLRNNSESNDASAEKDKIIYKVKSGESLGLIAQKFSCSVSQLQSWNNLRSNKIYVGQALAIYTKNRENYSKATNSEDKSTNNLKTNSAKTSVAKSNNSMQNNVEAKDEIIFNPFTNIATSKPEYVYYTVKSGDNLWTISRKHPGTSTESIMQLNNFGANYKLQPGMVLKVKKLK